MLDSRLRNCTSMEEAVRITGKTPLQIYKHLKRHGVKPYNYKTMFQQVRAENYSIEYELEDQI